MADRKYIRKEEEEAAKRILERRPSGRPLWPYEAQYPTNAKTPFQRASEWVQVQRKPYPHESGIAAPGMTNTGGVTPFQKTREWVQGQRKPIVTRGEGQPLPSERSVEVTPAQRARAYVQSKRQPYPSEAGMTAGGGVTPLDKTRGWIESFKKPYPHESGIAAPGMTAGGGVTPYQRFLKSKYKPGSYEAPDLGREPLWPHEKRDINMQRKIANIPYEMMPAHTTTTRRPETAAVGGEPGPGVPKPGTAEVAGKPPGPSTRYMDMARAGAGTSNKDLIHMIRGTQQTWANRKSPGVEYETPGEATAGMTRAEALVRSKMQADLEKERIKASKTEPKVIKLITPEGGETAVAYEGGRWIPMGGETGDADMQAAQNIATTFSEMSPADQETTFRGMPKRQREYLLQLLRAQSGR